MAMADSRHLVALLVLVTQLASVAHAAVETADDDGLRDPGRTAVAIFVVGDKPLPAGTRAPLLRGGERALQRHPTLAVQDKDLLLAEFAGETPSGQIADARTLAAAGIALLADERAAQAATKLAAAETALERVLAWVRKNELAEVQTALGVAHALAKDKAQARAAFRRLATWRPTWHFPANQWPELLPLWEKELAAVTEGRFGSLDLVSVPAGASVFVDGAHAGVTPVSADSLAVGVHYVTMRLDGHRRTVTRVTVDPKVQTLVAVTLERSSKQLLVQQSLARVRTELAVTEVPRDLADLRTVLYLDHVVIIHATTDGAKLRFDGYLYDLPSRRRLARVKGPAAGAALADTLEQSAETLVDALYAGIDVALPARKPKRRDRETRSSILSSPWLWSVLAVGAAAAAAPYVWDELPWSQGPSCPDGHACGAIILGDR